MVDPVKLSRLREAVLAAAPSLSGFSPIDRASPMGQGNVVAECADQDLASAAAAVRAFDWSDAADLAWRKARDRQAALSALLVEGGHLATGLRAAVWDLYTLENDRREAAGQVRWSVQEIVARVAAVLNSGAADAR